MKLEGEISIGPFRIKFWSVNEFPQGLRIWDVPIVKCMVVIEISFVGFFKTTFGIK